MLAILMLCALGSATLTAASIAYARRRGLLDAPGQRRSHRVPTPRGGGVAPVLVVLGLTTALGLRGGLSPADALAIVAAVALVAAIGWIDDHRPLGVRLRLVVHAAAGALAAALLLPTAPAWLWLLAVLAVVSAVNVCNFMDGINGIAASQAALVAAVIGWLLGAQDPEQGLLAFAVAAASIGFLPFNFPRARIFLGDVGSGALGLLIALLLLLAWRAGVASLAALLLLPSAFLIDAGLTLAARASRGKRLSKAHREHLYQWLVRSGASHAQVTAGYALWTAMMAAVCIALPQGNVGLAAAVYLAGAAIWWHSRRRLPGVIRRRRAG